jgi:lysozyme
MATSPQRKPLTGRQKAGAWGLAVTSAALVAAVSMHESSGKYIGTPYFDTIAKPPVWTVCDGITGKHVIPSKFYSRQECKDLATGEIEKHGLGLLECISRPIGQPQYEALTSWTFNVGVAAACKSTIVRQINAGEPKEVYCRGLMAWNMAGGKVVQGLTNRRQAEMARCLQ